MASSSSGVAAAMDIDPPHQQQPQPQPQSTLFPVAANVTTTPDKAVLTLYLEKHGGGSLDDEEEDKDTSFLVQVHYQQQGEEGREEPRVWTARIPAKETAGKTATIPAGDTARKMATLAKLLRRPEALKSLEVAFESSSTEEEATLTIKQLEDRGKRVLLKAVVLHVTDAPARSLATALSRTATQLAQAQRALLAAENQNGLYQEEHEKMQKVLDMRVADKEKVQEELMSKFNLLLNTKRAKIAELLQRSGEKEEEEVEVTDEEEGGEGEDEEEGRGGGRVGG